jgi:hypothetical protein
MARRWPTLSRTTKAAPSAAGLRASAEAGGRPCHAGGGSGAARVHRAPAAGQRQHLVAPQVAQVGACPHGPRRAPHRRHQRAAHGHREVQRGGADQPWLRSLRSSMTLMPPTKATVTGRPRTASGAGGASGPACSQSTTSDPAAGRPRVRRQGSSSQRRSRGSVACEPKPSTTTRTATPRRAAASSAGDHGRQPSSWKM